MVLGELEDFLIKNGTWSSLQRGTQSLKGYLPFLPKPPQPTRMFVLADLSLALPFPPSLLKPRI